MQSERREHVRLDTEPPRTRGAGHARQRSAGVRQNRRSAA